MSKEPKPEEWSKMIEDIKAIHAVLDALLAKRKEVGISRKDMAQRLGVSDYILKEFESEMSSPTIAMVQKYARALGIKVLITLEEY